MGDVYRATDEVLGRDVAVKLMLPVPGTLAASERFLREARAAARIRDPHVVAAYDFGDEDGCCFLAMELVGDRTVGEALRSEGPFPPDRAERIIRQAASGLAAAHRQGIVHRDIKPGNLLLAADGSVKVADFGIVRFLDDASTTMTSTGQIVGTSHFLSPERALGKPAEPASDVYALGCVLYQVLTGHPPFMADEPASIMFQHVERAPIPPSELRPDVAGDLEALVLWMLAKDPARRPTAAQVAAGVKRPVEPDTTSVLPVRRTPARPVLAGTAAAIALLASAVLGIALSTRDIEVPATNNLSPGEQLAPPPVTPSTPRAPGTPRAPVATATVTHRTTSQPSAASPRHRPTTHSAGPKDKAAKPGQNKPKKPKP
jgi:serine/threonine-protein kinase